MSEASAIGRILRISSDMIWPMLCLVSAFLIFFIEITTAQ